MSSKNFNIFEQHVEKLALAVGLAGAGFLIWMSLQPYQIPGTELELESAERKVSDAVRELNIAQESTKKRQPVIKVPNLVRQYEEYLKNPLSKNLVATAVPHFLPFQPPLRLTEVEFDRRGSGFVVTPTVPLPVNNMVTSWRGIIFDGPVGVVPVMPPTPPAGGAPVIPTVDKNLVVVSGYLPIDAFIRSMEEGTDITKKLLSDQQIAAIYRVEAQRRQKIGHNWSAWVSVEMPADLDLLIFPSNPMRVDPSQIDAAIVRLQEARTTILQPVSYYTPPPDSKPVLSLMQLAGSTPVVNVGGAADGPPEGYYEEPPVAPVRPVRPVRPTRPAPLSSAPVAPQSSSAPADVVDPNAPVLATTDPNYWIIDETIQPDAEYQYQVRLVMYNPTFNYMYEGARGELADENMRDKVTIASAWVVLPTIVQVPGDMYFYVTGYSAASRTINPNTPRINTPLFKWTQGRWFLDANCMSSLGTSVVGSIQITVPDSRPLRQSVATNYAVVDIIPSGDIGNDVEAILLDPNGQLIVRKRSTDLPKWDTMRKSIETPRPNVPTQQPPRGRGPANRPASNNPGFGGFSD